MDDIIFQSSNQNSVYVLNSNYRYYGNFARLNVIEPNDAISKNQSHCQHASLTNSGNHSFSTTTLPMQYKLRHFGKFCDVPEAIENSVTTAPTTTINPPATTCLASTDVLQKFFNCNFVANVGGCDSLHSIHADCCSGGAAGACTDTNPMQNTCKIKPNNNNKKKNINLKPSLIAKKTKFRKFIEEEKWKTSDECIFENEYQNNHNVRVDFPGSSRLTEFRTNSSVKESNTAESTTLTASMAAMTTCEPLNNIVKHYWNRKMKTNTAESGRKKYQQQNQSNNWSGSGESNNQQQQAQQQLKVLKSTQQQKTNYELYKDAADLLGLPCTLCDNCRCLECQSSYFDCDDSDSFAEVSNSDEYDDDTMNVFNNSFELLMYANCYSDDTMTVNGISTIKQRQRQKVVRCSQEQRQPNFTCADVNCNAREFCGVDRDSYNMAVNGGEEAANGTEGTYVINQNGLHSVQCNEGNELENCTSLNGLSLRDANIDMPLSTGSENRG
ncbi:uncharacterized protein [Bactrocera oleae]|uniref:uncharacterized protein n=1 Tax=Bactrocera oleae TaxID=104688 RepID=UPI00387ECF3B